MKRVRREIEEEVVVDTEAEEAEVMAETTTEAMITTKAVTTTEAMITTKAVTTTEVMITTKAAIMAETTTEAMITTEAAIMAETGITTEAAIMVETMAEITVETMAEITVETMAEITAEIMVEITDTDIEAGHAGTGLHSAMLTTWKNAIQPSDLAILVFNVITMVSKLSADVHLNSH